MQSALTVPSLLLDVMRISDRLPDGIPAYYMFDKDNKLTGEKESPSDNKDRWEYLLENNVYPLTDRMWLESWSLSYIKIRKITIMT